MCWALMFSEQAVAYRCLLVTQLVVKRRSPVSPLCERSYNVIYLPFFIGLLSSVHRFLLLVRLEVEVCEQTQQDDTVRDE
jgi:hypothetical protein